MSQNITSKERINWLRLIRSENVGPITFYRLLEQFGTASDALDALPELAKKGGRSKKFKVFSKTDAETELEKLESLHGHLILRDDEHYPPLLRQVEDAPPILQAIGHHHLLKKKSISVVGARNASISGCNFAAQISAELGKAGFSVVSGLARGIDGAAHAAALATGTVGVQGGGVDVIYPRENKELYQQMVERGCVLSEPALGTKPQARHFPRRNRIISGMSRGVVVVEASPKSGSLITARMALEQNREVFAVPGSPLDPRSKGANGLIREGAILIESAEDIVAELLRNGQVMEEIKKHYILKGESKRPDQSEIEKNRDRIIESLSFSPVCVDEIIRQCQICPTVVQRILLELELAGRLERSFGNKVSLIN